MADEPIDIQQQKSGAVKIGSSIDEAYGNINVGGAVAGRDIVYNIQNIVQTPAPVDHTTAPLKGLGLWVWKLEQCEAGNPARIVERAQATGLSHVVIKIAC